MLHRGVTVRANSRLLLSHRKYAYQASLSLCVSLAVFCVSVSVSVSVCVRACVRACVCASLCLYVTHWLIRKRTFQPSVARQIRSPCAVTLPVHRPLQKGVRFHCTNAVSCNVVLTP